MSMKGDGYRGHEELCVACIARPRQDEAFSIGSGLCGPLAP
jgi:hypothetical protein